MSGRIQAIAVAVLFGCTIHAASADTWVYGYDNRNQLVSAKEYNKDPGNGGVLQQEVDYKYLCTVQPQTRQSGGVFPHGPSKSVQSAEAAVLALAA